jgi:hypothetical protein
MGGWAHPATIMHEKRATIAFMFPSSDKLGDRTPIVRGSQRVHIVNGYGVYSDLRNSALLAAYFFPLPGSAMPRCISARTPDGVTVAMAV